MRLRAVQDGDLTNHERRARGNEDHRKRRRLDEDLDDNRPTRRQRKEQYRRDEGKSRRSRSPEVEQHGRRDNGQHSRTGDTRRDNDVERESRHDGARHRSPRREKHSSRAYGMEKEESLRNTHNKKRRKRSTSRDSDTSHDYNYHRHRRKEHRSGHYRSHRDESPPSQGVEHSRHKDRRSTRSRTPSRANDHTDTPGDRRTFRKHSPSSESDPLEALVGPLPPSHSNNAVHGAPPLVSRGRGAYRPSASAMDQHFSSTYDPSLDLRPDSEPEDEKEDWDLALEALRDRELWKQKGAERLRAAGFGDEEIKKWESSGKEKGAEDVKWTGKGEEREWDRGKVVQENGEKKGEVELEAAWGKKSNRGGFLNDFKKALG